MIERAMLEPEAHRAYHPFDAAAAARYAATCPPLREAAAAGATLQAREVGDGNLNLVFIVSATRPAAHSADGLDAADSPILSAVIKQALPYVRLVGESWPLTVERNRIERRAYEVYAAIVPDLVPRIYHGDDAQALFVMEDLSHLRIVRAGLIAQQPYPRLVGDVARFCAETLLRTSDFYLDSGEKKRLMARSVNPELCKITEDLVLTDPFGDAPSNHYEPDLRTAVDSLWADARVADNVVALRYAFMTRAEALLHGDLHTGSIMAGPDETKIVDAEFAFYGPIGFDVGMFIANLFLNAVSQRAQGHGARSEMMLRAAVEMWETFCMRVRDLLVAAPVWLLPAGARDSFMHHLLRDATGFAGAETIRRTIGLARVADLEGIADLATRVRAKAEAIAIGRALIAQGPHVDSFAQVLHLVRQAIEEETV